VLALQGDKPHSLALALELTVNGSCAACARASFSCPVACPAGAKARTPSRFQGQLLGRYR